MVLPALEELGPRNIIDAVDIFLEDGYFSEEDVRILHKKAKKFNIPLKIHADEFINLEEGASLACELSALSADHLLAISKNGNKIFFKIKYCSHTSSWHRIFSWQKAM